MLPQPHTILHRVMSFRDMAIFSFFPTFAHLSFLRDYQLRGSAYLPLGAILEMSTAVSASCLGDGNLPEHKQMLLDGTTVTNLAALNEEMNPSVPALSMKVCAGQLNAAGNNAAGQKQDCLSTQVRLAIPLFARPGQQRKLVPHSEAKVCKVSRLAFVFALADRFPAFLHTAFWD